MDIASDLREQFKNRNVENISTLSQDYWNNIYFSFGDGKMY